MFFPGPARSAPTSHAELSQLTGVTQELLREQFAAADREAIRLYSEPSPLWSTSARSDQAGTRSRGPHL
jgi:hypothetical protein